ncbi:MAG: ribbon-helix-helix domain-containing protein [Candidatus Aureabacteria bacterium]|nr:ribbon-helix-helix domain-containing protein [Candidatus Auribacterota bacterium]
MRTIQMTLDDELVSRVDRAVEDLHTSRSAFTREALRQAIRNLQTRGLEEKHRMGYARKPILKGEFAAWESEQAWGDE